jgi:hypothetical protein
MNNVLPNERALWKKEKQNFNPICQVYVCIFQSSQSQKSKSTSKEKTSRHPITLLKTPGPCTNFPIQHGPADLARERSVTRGNERLDHEKCL